MYSVRWPLTVKQLLLLVPVVFLFDEKSPNPLIKLTEKEYSIHHGRIMNKNLNLPYYGYFLKESERALFQSKNITINFIRNEPCDPHNTGIQEIWLTHHTTLLPYIMLVTCEEEVSEAQLTEEKRKMIKLWERNVESQLPTNKTRFYCRFSAIEKQYTPRDNYCEFFYVAFEYGGKLLYSGAFNNDDTSERQNMHGKWQTKYNLSELYRPEDEQISSLADCKTIRALQNSNSTINNATETCVIAQLTRNKLNNYLYQHYIHCCCFTENHCPHLDYNRGEMTCMHGTRNFTVKNGQFSDVSTDVFYNIDPANIVPQNICHIRINANIEGQRTFSINLNETCTFSKEVDKCTSFRQSVSLSERSVCCVLNITASNVKSDVQLWEKFNNIVMKYITGAAPDSSIVEGRFKVNLLKCKYLIEIHESRDMFHCHAFFESNSTKTDLRIADIVKKNRKMGSIQFLVSNGLINYDNMFLDVERMGLKNIMSNGCVHVFRVSCTTGNKTFLTECILQTIQRSIFRPYTMCFCGSKFNETSCDQDVDIYKKEIDDLMIPTCYVGKNNKTRKLETSKKSFVCIERFIFGEDKTFASGSINYDFVGLRDLNGRTNIRIAWAKNVSESGSVTFSTPPIYDRCYYEKNAIVCYCLAKWESSKLVKEGKVMNACNNGSMVKLFLSVPHKFNVRDLSMNNPELYNSECMEMPNANVSKRVFSEELYEMCIYEFGNEKYDGGYGRHYFVNGKSVTNLTEAVNAMICNISEWTALEHVAGCSCRSYNFYDAPWPQDIMIKQNIKKNIRVAKEIYRDNFNNSKPPIVTQSMLTRAQSLADNRVNQFVQQEADYLDILMAIEDIKVRQKKNESHKKADTLVKSSARKARTISEPNVDINPEYTFICCCHNYIRDVPKGLVTKRLKPLNK